MKTTFVLALALVGMGLAGHSARTTGAESDGATLIARGGSNCPVYYGCPAPPSLPNGGGDNRGGSNGRGGKHGGGNSGSTNSGGNNGGETHGGGHGGADDPTPH